MAFILGFIVGFMWLMFKWPLVVSIAILLICAWWITIKMHSK